MAFWKGYLIALAIGLPLAVLAECYQVPGIAAEVCRRLKRPLACSRRLLRRINMDRIAPMALGLSVLGVMGLTWWGLWRHPEFSCEECDTGIFEVLRVVYSVLEGDSGDFRAHAAYLRVAAEALAVLVPASAVATAAALLWNYLPHHVPWFSQVWYIFSELEPNSIRMAKSISKEMERSGETGVFIFLRTRRGKQEQDVLDELKDINYYFYPKNEQRFLRLYWRRERTLRFFYLSENTDENFERMQEFLSAAGQRRLLQPRPVELEDGQFQHEFYLLSETESASMLITRLREKLDQSPHAAVFAHTELRLLDRFRAVSYDLLRRQPLHRFRGGEDMNVLLLGFGRIGREFFRAASSVGMMRDCPVKFTICDMEIHEKLDALRALCPELEQSASTDPRPLDVDSSALNELLDEKDFHYIVVSLGDDERNIRVASRLKRLYRQRHWQHRANVRTGDEIQPQICVNIEDSAKHAYTEQLWKTSQPWDHSLHTFGGLDQAFTADVLMPGDLWNAARWVHRLVNQTQRRELRNWNEYNRRSSLACAAHAEYHVAGLCGGIGNLSDGEMIDRYQRALEALTPDEFEAMVDTEHERWMAYVRSEGMQYADTSLVQVYFGENNNHVDILARLTPCLVDGRALAQVQTVVDTLRRDNGRNAAGPAPLPFRERDACIVRNAARICAIARKGDRPEA